MANYSGGTSSGAAGGSQFDYPKYDYSSDSSDSVAYTGTGSAGGPQFDYSKYDSSDSDIVASKPTDAVGTREATNSGAAVGAPYDYYDSSDSANWTSNKPAYVVENDESDDEFEAFAARQRAWGPAGLCRPWRKIHYKVNRQYSGGRPHEYFNLKSTCCELCVLLLRSTSRFRESVARVRWDGETNSISVETNTKDNHTGVIRVFRLDGKVVWILQGRRR